MPLERWWWGDVGNASHFTRRASMYQVKVLACHSMSLLPRNPNPAIHLAPHTSRVFTQASFYCNMAMFHCSHTSSTHDSIHALVDANMLPCLVRHLNSLAFVCKPPTTNQTIPPLSSHPPSYKNSLYPPPIILPFPQSLHLKAVFTSALGHSNGMSPPYTSVVTLPILLSTSR